MSVVLLTGLLPRNPTARQRQRLSRYAGLVHPPGRGALRPSGAKAARATCCLAVAALLVGCTTLETTRNAVGVAVAASREHSLELLAQAEAERRRLREARCYSPLLTPATIGAAAADDRLGRPWVDELLRDCPALASFLTQQQPGAETAFSSAAGQPPTAPLTRSP